MKPLSLFVISFFLSLGTFFLWPTTINAQGNGDMISPANNLDACIAVDGELTATPAIRPMACNGASKQLWQVDGNGYWHIDADTSYCLARTTSNSWDLTILLCNDSRAISLQPDINNSAVYVVSGTTLAMDNYGSVVGLYSKHSGSNQQWKWLQPDMDTVDQQGCDITYPVAADDTATYQRELACHRVSSLQPPYIIPVNALRTTNFPGSVPANSPVVTQSVTFDLAFKSHSYLRMASPPRNWKSMGLYAPPQQIVSITVDNATSAELSDVYAQIGVHTDRLSPTSNNVQGGQFLRNPDVVIRIRLVPGENLMRSPYGGPIVLVSERSQSKILNLTIANAVQAPYFSLGQTSEAEWLTRRNATTPFAEVEGPQSVLHIPSSEVNTLSFADITAVAQYYEQMANYHNQLAGLSANAALPHQTPQGQHRHVEDIQITAGWGHSGFPIMYYTAWQIAVPDESIYRSTGWGMWHELGHNYQMGAWSYVYGTEVTVNLFSLFAQEQYFGNSRLINSNTYANAIARLNDPAIIDKWTGADPFEQLVFHDQLRLAFPQLNWQIWAQLMRRYRDMSSTDYNALNNEQKKRDKFMELLCDITNSNLAPHFTAWTIVTSQSSKDFCASKPALTQQTWLIDGAKPIQPGAGSGQVRRDLWNSISGRSVLSLTSNLAFPNNPSSSGLITTGLETPSNVADNYGQRLRAYLHPPLTGEYRFWIAANERSELWISTDEDPANAQLVLTLPTATDARGFDDTLASIQRSVPITLQAGHKYYIEVLHKEGSGSDHLSIAWEVPASGAIPHEVRKVIDARYLSPYAGDLALRLRPAAGQATTIQPGEDVTFAIEVFNQSSALLHDVQVVESLPTGFSLSPANSVNWVRGYRYIRFQALSEAGNRGPWTSMAELNLLDSAGQMLNRSNWRVKYVDSENPTAPVTNILDGNTATIWHTMWWTAPPPHPHEVQIDLAAITQNIGGFTYLPSQSGSNGRVGQYRFYVSADGDEWLQAATGSFADNATLKTVTFTLPAPNLAFGQLVGPIAPGASSIITLILRANNPLTLGHYLHQAEALIALDATNSRLLDQDSISDANPNNDIVIDDEINNGQGDEDDHDVISVTVALETPTPTATATATETATPTPTGTVPHTATGTSTATPTATATPTQPTTIPITTPLQAKITILVDAQPDSPQNFSYRGTLGTFYLDNPAADDGDQIAGAQTFMVAPGIYTITQRTLASSWFLTNLTYSATEPVAIDRATLTAVITAKAGSTSSITFTNQRASAIAVYSFEDLNGNGLRNSNDPFTNDWTIKLFSAPTVVTATLTTSSYYVGSTGITQSGRAIFRGILPGTYTLCQETQTGWEPTRPITHLVDYATLPCYAPVTLLPGRGMVYYFGNKRTTPISTELDGPLEMSPNPLEVVMIYDLAETDEDGNEIAQVELVLPEDEEEALLFHRLFMPIITGE